MGDDDNMSELAQGFLSLSETMQPLREFGKGLRAQFVEDGWSEPIAEKIAAEVLIQFMRKALSS